MRAWHILISALFWGVPFFQSESLCAQTLHPQTSLEESTHTLSKEEETLVDLINRFRVSLGKSSLPVVRSLSFVARTHARDLVLNEPDTYERVENHFFSVCNVHSWSERSGTHPCCYRSNENSEANRECMYEKPRELSSYLGKGFEIIASFQPFRSVTSNGEERIEKLDRSTLQMSAEEAFRDWRESPGHLVLMANETLYQEDVDARTGRCTAYPIADFKTRDMEFKAIGVGIYRGASAAWFGKLPPKEGDLLYESPPFSLEVSSTEKRQARGEVSKRRILPPRGGEKCENPILPKSL